VSEPAVDVIIAARNEARRIGSCVAALRRQDYPGRLRVCVVDNASEDATAARAAASGAEVVHERRRGRGAARNAGLRATDGDFVAFVDAHVVVGSDWVRRMVEAFTDSGVGGCQGVLDHRASDRRVSRFLHKTAELSDDRILPRSLCGEDSIYPWLATGNCMYRRAALARVGGFNERLVACEDVELSWRVVACGYRLACASGASATHYDDRAWPAFVTKGWGYGRGAAQVEFAFRVHGARTRFGSIGLWRRPEAVLASLSYVLGFRFQQLRRRLRLDPQLEQIPLDPVDAAFRPWFFWRRNVRLRISPWVIFWTYEGGARSVIVQPRARRRFVLDDTGDLIWRLLACEQSREEITDRIVAVYGVPAT
jgi:glycosyltransferase involved in cell wall biosynthesis